MSNTNRNRRYKGYDLVNVGLSWYIGPHDPLGHRGEVTHGTHIGTSFAAAKREIDARYAIGPAPAPINAPDPLRYRTICLRAEAREFAEATGTEEEATCVRALKIAALNYVRALVESQQPSLIRGDSRLVAAYLGSLSTEIEP